MNNTSPPAGHLDRVAVRFPSPGGDQPAYTAIADVSLTVADGEFLSVVGPTGCGKSTILNMIAGLLTPSEGSVAIFGETLRSLNRQVGYLFQADAVMPWRDVLRNLVAGLEIRGVPEAERNRLGRDWLSRVGLGGKDYLYPHQLSGGMRRR